MKRGDLRIIVSLGDVDQVIDLSFEHTIVEVLLSLTQLGLRTSRLLASSDQGMETQNVSIGRLLVEVGI